MNTELRLKNEMTQSYIAQWIKDKVEIKSYTF